MRKWGKGPKREKGNGEERKEGWVWGRKRGLREKREWEKGGKGIKETKKVGMVKEE